MRYLIFVLLLIALVTYCIVDIVQHRDEKPHGVPKAVWVLVVFFLPYLGCAVWIVLKIMGRGKGRPAPPRTSRPPDDDPEYLRWLRDQERRRRDEKGREQEGGG